jgi:hypothetical protein
VLVSLFSLDKISETLLLEIVGRFVWHNISHKFLGREVAMHIWLNVSFPCRVLLYIVWIVFLLMSFG